MATLPPPTSPPAEYPERSRAYSTLSNSSRRSRRSSGSGPKLDKFDLTETHDDKKRLNANSKADPTKAINEAQPSAVALEKSNMGDLRTMQHKDFAGNVINDPDRANPTRPRMERPLETIMSFQRAAEYTDSTRRSPYSGGPGSKMDYYPPQDPRAESNRRASYYGGSQANYGPQGRTRPAGGGYYGRSSSYGFRPDSFIEEGAGPNQYQPSRSNGRNSNAGTYGPNGEYMSPTHSHQISYETMTSGSEENAKTTNPSSVNSSVDHIEPYRKPADIMAGMNSYGSSNSYGHPMQNGNGQMQNGYGQQNGNAPMRNSSAPMMSPPPANNPRVPIKLGSSMSAAELEAEAAKLSPAKEKRKSWLKRRFSRRNS